MNKYHNIVTLLLICCLTCLVSVLDTPLYAQLRMKGTSVGTRVQRLAERKAQKFVRKKKTDLRSELRSGVKDIKQGEVPHKFPKARGPQEADNSASYYTMHDFINDPDKRVRIQNRQNNKRFVELFGAWWTTPSEYQLEYDSYIDSLLRARASVDSSQYRVPKEVNKENKNGEGQPMTVLGWHPYWNDNLYKTYDYNIINAIAFYSYEINPLDGSNRNADHPKVIEFMNGEFTAAIREMKDSTRPVSVLLSLTLHREDEVREFLDMNTIAQQNVIDSIITILSPEHSNADGIEIDIENIPFDLKDDYIQFVKKISSSIYKAYPDISTEYKYVYLSVPAKDPKEIYNIKELNDFVDFFVIRGDNFFYDPTADKLEQGPQAPLNFNSASPDYDLKDAIDTYADRIGRYNTNRLILAFPYTGTMWQKTQGQDEPVLLYPYISYSQIKFDFVAKAQDGFGKIDTFDEKNCYTWSFIDSSVYPNVTTTIYFDDADSYRKKYKLIDQFRMGGVAINALGYDNGFTELWKVLAEEFTVVKIPKDKRAERIEEATGFFMRNSTIILAVLFYITIFASFGFFVALMQRDTRQRLFENGRFRVLYLGFFTLVLLILGSYLGLFDDKNSILFYGILSGGLIGWLLFKFASKSQAARP
ncbi:MAG: glycosyl hydrolase family 18 protein [Saprospiraceae bacterium]|nr:glycosyl hydrolase family 18 protein [Saprospiraceae bacterium]